jgi:hypothetical protein
LIGRKRDRFDMCVRSGAGLGTNADLQKLTRGLGGVHDPLIRS